VLCAHFSQVCLHCQKEPFILMDKIVIELKLENNWKA
jgi:hypothetical protein